jgi:hypothetical protein
MPVFPTRDDYTPKRDPDTPPDSSDPTGPCPRCGRVSNFSVEGTAPVTFLSGVHVMTQEGRHERDDLQRVSILMCSGCRECIVVIEDKFIGNQRVAEGMRYGGTINYRGVWWWPPPGVADLDASIPESVAEAYREGVRAMWARAPRAAAVMFRRTLEAIVKTNGSEAAKAAANKNLATGLSVMADEGALDRSLAEWAKEIRIVGNVGGHFDLVDDVAPEEAHNLSRLLRELMRYLYEMPARIGRSRGGPAGPAQ